MREGYGSRSVCVCVSVTTLTATWVIPCQINTQNGHPSRILPKLGEYIPYPKG